MLKGSKNKDYSDILEVKEIVYTHYRNNKLYTILNYAKVQINDKWVGAICYTEYGKKEIYVRAKKDFYKKFKRINKKVKI